uniref:Uncharacterized protein n=1 Tax=viral metagenome TaxID=1070528 RepID=A0A6M3LP73_9ZZZZ
MKIEELGKYEVGKEYLFKASSRKNRIKGILTDKYCNYAGLSLYHGTDAIEFKTKRGTVYTLSLYGLEEINEM